MNILIVDDQPRTRQSLKALLATCLPVEVVREAANGQDAVLLVQESRPDLVLMDIEMPGMDGLQATRLIKTAHPQIKIIALSMYNDYNRDALAAGASVFVSKGDSPDRLIQAIENVVIDPNPVLPVKPHEAK